MAYMIKNLPAMQETWVQSLDQDHPLEKEMATHSNILAWRIPWTEKPGRLHEVAESETTEKLTLSLFIFILLIFESLTLQLKILIYLLKTNNCNILWNYM